MSKINKCIVSLDNSCVPVWFMRQAGRYLPEFRKIRSENPNFLKLCFDIDLATEITLQPINRFNLDAAIIFSDILVVPHAMGQNVEFRKDIGPIIKNFNIKNFLETDLKDFTLKLSPVYEAIKKTRKKLDNKKSLIAFIGAPWTLIIYLLTLKKNNILDKKLLVENEEIIEKILKKLDEFLKQHIINQKVAGADIIQIFDSWAGLIDEEKLDEYCYRPNKSLVEYCKKIKLPVICFPKGLKDNYKRFVNVVKPDCISIDNEIDPNWARDNFENICIQGGLNPDLLLQNEEYALKEVEKYLEIFKNKSYIFNLGHGILPQTNPEIVKKIVKKVKGEK